MILYNSFHHESALGVKATYFSKTYLPTIMTAIVLSHDRAGAKYTMHYRQLQPS